MENFRMLSIWVLLISYMRISTSLDSITPSQFIKDGETLVSAGGTFELGFFSPGNSRSRYLGVWYKNISPLTVVWVANRETPIHNISGVLQVNENGVLFIRNATNTTVWSSNVSTKAENPIAQLLDSGNLVVKNGQEDQDTIDNEDYFLWQSFDYPCDTLLPRMKLGWNLVRGLDRFISSWKSEDDPVQGEYTIKIDLRGYPQLVYLKGSVIKSRLGSWNGLSFTGYPVHQLEQVFRYEFVFNDKEVYFEYQLLDRSAFTTITSSPSGTVQRFLWSSRRRQQVIASGEADQCDDYAWCGANSICSMNDNTPICACLKGFVPKIPEEWNISFWSSGCVQKTTFNCNDKYGFWRYTNMKLPDSSSSWFSKTMTLEECQKSCLQNCSCAAYANFDIRNGGSGCLQWFDNLIDMKQFSHAGQDLYIRVLSSELDSVANKGHGNIRKKKLIGVSVSSAIVIMGMIILGLTTCIWRKKLKSPVAGIFYRNNSKTKLDLPKFDFSIIAKATDTFSRNNKLGEGGFGPVYKGTLIDGLEVAVKRLSKKSGQGVEEFKNEVMLIAKLQHRNLVKLLGYCVKGEEKVLIYEYMPNKSLDLFIFDESRSKLLDWLNRFNIISGIARGLLYLHQDSTLRIIHRDLKISNILLDTNLNPKISDFGLARTFLENQIEANTNKVVGTYGYMSPEYIMRGHFSTKSDIFSFGVIIIEIISGKKNREFSDTEHYHNLLGHAWRLWAEGRPLDLMDKVLGERFTPSEVIRCIQVGLLCVQQTPKDRPDMSYVVLMLDGEKSLPKPKVPGFYIERDIMPEADPLFAKCQLFSTNGVSLTLLEPR